jgi:hypothetical protein
MSRLGHFANIAESCIQTLDVELIFECHWHTVQRSDELAVFDEIVVELLCSTNGLFEADFGQTICLL